ncbi:MAG: hypothetical protein IJ137_09410 [Eubacterium sp.]|nr:hypothetical protein [Eubacterium sp.]
MKLDLKGTRLTRCEFRNDMGPNMKINLQVNVNNRVQLPKEGRIDSAGTVLTKAMLGSPLQPLYLYIEQIASFADSEPDGQVMDNESLMSLYKTICIPQAVERLEAQLKILCAVYHIPEIKLQRAEKEQYN